MSDRYPEDVFVLNRQFLRYAGVWIDHNWSTPVKTIYRIYAVSTFIFIDCVFTCSAIAYLLFEYQDIYTFIRHLSVCLTHIMSSIKIVFWYCKRHVLIQLLATMEDDKLHYQQCQGFHPGSIFLDYKKHTIRIMLIFLLVATVSGVSAHAPTILIVLLKPPEYGNSFYQTLPYANWIPFDYSPPHRYLMVALFQFVCRVSHLISIVGLDMLFMSMMNFIAAHLTILQGAFESIGRRVSDQLPDVHTKDTRMALMNKEMKRCCDHLETVLRVRDDLEDVYRYLALCQVTVTFFILCTTLYALSGTSAGSDEFGRIFAYLTIIVIELYAYCWFGNEVTLKAQDISLAIWKSDWTECDKKYKNAMPFTMLRVNQPIYMTLGKLAPLTMDTFVAVCKASYSAYTMLKNTQE